MGKSPGANKRGRKALEPSLRSADGDRKGKEPNEGVAWYWEERGGVSLIVGTPLCGSTTSRKGGEAKKPSKMPEKKEGGGRGASLRSSMKTRQDQPNHKKKKQKKIAGHCQEKERGCVSNKKLEGPGKLVADRQTAWWEKGEKKKKSAVWPWIPGH